jgi:hypothetical protein
MNDLVQIDPTALQALRAKSLIDSAPNWQPAEGEVLEGVIHGSRTVSNPFGAVQQQMIVQQPDGSLVAVWLSDWLLNQLRAQSADMGDLVSLTFHGQERSQRGALYNKFSVSVLKVSR